MLFLLNDVVLNLDGGEMAPPVASNRFKALSTAFVEKLGRELFAVSLDPDVAKVQGIRVQTMSTLMAVLAAIVVVVGMRVVGLLLVSAIMIVPVAAAQQISRSFRSTAALAVCIGLLASITGLTGSFYIEVPPGPAIVIVALACFAILAIAAVPVRRRRKVHT